MARRPRLSIPGYPYHIIQRGNNRQPVFFAESDYAYYRVCLYEAKCKYDCRIYAYVLMTNHVHLLLEPSRQGSLGQILQYVGRRYVRYINNRHGRSGTLWEGRFKSAIVSRDNYLIMCSRYIELNPLRAGIVSRPGDYIWSSYRFHAEGKREQLVDDDPLYAGLGSTQSERQQRYKQWIASSLSDNELHSIRTATQKGTVIGNQRFERVIESTTGRSMKLVTPGRPRRNIAKRAREYLL